MYRAGCYTQLGTNSSLRDYVEHKTVKLQASGWINRSGHYIV